MTEFVLDGTALNSFGIITQLEDYVDNAPRRGANQNIPFRHGGRFVKKYYDSRTLMFGLTISGASLAIVEKTFDSLKKLLGYSGEKTLTMYMSDGTVRSGLVSCNKSLQVARPYITVWKIVIEFDMAYPFFRDVDYIPDNTTVINASPKAMTVDNTGTVEEDEPVIVLTGPLQSTTIMNNTNGNTLTYTGTISAGHTVTIQVTDGEFTAVHSVSGNVIGNISHSGSPALMVFETGENSLSITDGTATTGTVKVSFRPPYL